MYINLYFDDYNFLRLMFMWIYFCEWQMYTQDDYKDPEPVNLESWKKRLTRKIKHHLIAGGSMEEDLV